MSEKLVTRRSLFLGVVHGTTLTLADSPVVSVLRVPVFRGGVLVRAWSMAEVSSNGELDLFLGKIACTLFVFV